MFKRVMLLVGPLVAAVAAFLYFSSADRESLDRRAMTSTRPAAEDSRPTIREERGESPFMTRVDEYTGLPTFEFKARAWEPIKHSGYDTTYSLEDPEIRLHTPDGQIIYVTARGGEMDVTRSPSQKYDAKRGWLRDEVKVVIDRTRREWREQNPDRAERDQHPDELIHIDLGSEARFDMANWRLTADGAITVRSPEADIEANAGTESLVLIWNQVDKRLDLLTFQYGGVMRLRNASGMVEFGLPGSAAPREPADAALLASAKQRSPDLPPPLDRVVLRSLPPMPTGDQMLAEVRRIIATPSHRVDAAAPSSAPHEPAYTIAEDGTIVLADKRRPKREADTYAAVFHENVQVEQRRAEAGGPLTVTGSLECDLLELVFDIGREARRAGRLGPVQDGPPSADPLRALLPRDALMPPSGVSSQPAESSEIVLRWTGKLDLRPLALDAAEQSGRRFDAVATGRQVVVNDAQGQATCQRMIYRGENSAVWLSGMEEPARLFTESGREMKAAEIVFDRKAGRGRLQGGGRLFDPSGDDSGAVFARAGKEQSPAGGMRTKGDQALEIVWTRGVDLETGQVRRPADDGSGRLKTVDYLRQAAFDGDVHVRQGDQHLTGEHVAAAFGPPRRPGALADHITQMRAIGGVHLHQREMDVKAAQLTVDLTLTPEGRSAPKHADGAGNVSVVDGERHFEAQRVAVDFEQASLVDDKTGEVSDGTVIRHVIAERDVTAHDPAEGLDLTADWLDAVLAADGTLERAEIIGPGETGWAYAQSGDYEVNGHRVTIDLPAQNVSVPGRGEAKFVTRSDFDGRELDEAVQVSITFEQSMALEGARNIGTFLGRVRSSTDTHEMVCNDRLFIRFADVKRATGQTPDSGRTVAPRKRPVAVLAEGDVVALTTNPDPSHPERSLTRMRLDGPVMEVDLRAGRLNIPGRGSLLIEDYRPPRAGRDEAIAGPGGLMPIGRGGNEGPSATLFLWANAMSFNINDDLVTFDENVTMKHLSGKRLLEGDLGSALAANLQPLRLQTGRQAELSCENLIVQFLSQSRADGKRSAPLDVRWTEVRHLEAAGNAYLKDNDRSLRGERLTYQGDRNIITLRGSPGRDASLDDMSEVTQHVRSWRGPVITWNRATGAIDAPGTRVTAR